MESSANAAIKVVAALIYKDDRLLVCQRRADATFPLKWEFPGGKVENGEADVDALRRELREELGIEMGGAALVYEHEHSYPGGPRVLLRFYRVSEFSGEVENRIFRQVSWCRLTDLRRFDFLEGDQPIIEALLGEGKSALLGA